MFDDSAERVMRAICTAAKDESKAGGNGVPGLQASRMVNAVKRKGRFKMLYLQVAIEDLTDVLPTTRKR